MPAEYTGPRYFNLASDKNFNLVNDVVLSIEYSISGNTATEAGLSFFITHALPLSGGGSEAGLAYTGTIFVDEGITTAVAGFGMDTHGYFGLSSGDIDGLSINSLSANSIAARAGFSERFSLSALGNYYVKLPNTFSIVNPNDDLHSLRYRVGNLGRTMYLDYRSNYDDPYTALAEVDIGDRVNLLSAYKVGIGYASPLSIIEEAVANIRIRSIHIEGLEFTTP